MSTRDLLITIVCVLIAVGLQQALIVGLLAQIRDELRSRQ